MIWELIPLGLILIGFGGAFVFLIKRTESVSDQEIEALIKQNSAVEKISNFYQSKIKPRLESRELENRFLILLEKFLRWLRILTLKTENWLTGKIDQVKELRNRPKFDPYYWLSVRRSALEKKIEQTFSKKSLSRSFDPLKEELKLIKKRVNQLDEWVHLVRFYLEKGELEEARRLLAKIWLKGEKNSSLSLLIEEFSLKVQETEIKQKQEQEIEKQEEADNNIGSKEGADRL
ncbi:MAG: hypothetical protein AB1721_00585 [Patescibacteria group bacterium]